MLTCDLQLLPCQEEPATVYSGGPDHGPTSHRAAERLLAAMRRVEASAQVAAIRAVDDTTRRLALLDVTVALGTLVRVKSEVATRLLVLAHAGRARRAYAQARGGKK